MQFDHVNIHARDQDAMRDFLVALLGVRVGWRPSFSFPGYWLYLGEQPVIHLQDQLRSTAESGAGWVDHLAFATDAPPAVLREQLRAMGAVFAETRLPDTEIAQFFVQGPEGIKVELQCRTAAT
jgi:catechol 2,3-dioxygenase-like lactoylglutathione lyase family enzyme